MIRPEIERPRAEQPKQAVQPGQVDGIPGLGEDVRDPNDPGEPSGKRFSRSTRFALGQFDVEDRTRWGIHGHRRMNTELVSEALGRCSYGFLPPVGQISGPGSSAGRIRKSTRAAGGIRMAQERTVSVTHGPKDPGESAEEADRDGGIRFAPINGWHSGRLDYTNVEIIRAARGLLSRAVDLLK